MVKDRLVRCPLSVVGLAVPQGYLGSIVVAFQDFVR
jgi:hypothetical protein